MLNLLFQCLVLYTLYRVVCAIYSIQGCLCYILYTGLLVLYTLYRVACAIYSIQGCLCYILYTGLFVLYTLYRVVCAIYSIQGCSFGYFVGGWGKPPVDELGRPLYGDVFGMWQQDQGGAPPIEQVDRTLWGELESEEEEEMVCGSCILVVY